MKTTRILLITIICMVVALSGAIMSIFHAVDSKVASPDEYKRLLDKHGAYAWIIDEAAEEIVGYTEENPEKYGLIQQIDFKKYVRLVVTEEWIKGNIEKLLDGIFPYIKGSTNRLPVIEIADLKQKVLKIISGDILKGYGAAGDAGAAISEMLAMELEESFHIPDRINIDEYINNSTGMKEGVQTARAVFKAYEILWNAWLVATLLLVLLIAVLCRGVRGMLKSTGICALSAGILCLLLYAVLDKFLSSGLLRGYIIRCTAGIPVDLERVYPALVDLLYTIGTVILRDGLLIAAAGILLITLAIMPFRAGMRVGENGQKAIFAVKMVSAVVIMVLLVLTVADAAFMLRDIISSLRDFSDGVL